VTERRQVLQVGLQLPKEKAQVEERLAVEEHLLELVTERRQVLQVGLQLPKEKAQVEERLAVEEHLLAANRILA
jgi:hypothetical protein